MTGYPIGTPLPLEQCDSCGGPYTGYALPDDVWTRIAPRPPLGGRLCHMCALTKLGAQRKPPCLIQSKRAELLRMLDELETKLRGPVEKGYDHNALLITVASECDAGGSIICEYELDLEDLAVLRAALNQP